MDLYKAKNWLKLLGWAVLILFSPILAAAILKLGLSTGNFVKILSLLSESVVNVGGYMLFGVPTLLATIAYRVGIKVFFPGTAMNFWNFRKDAADIRFYILVACASVFSFIDYVLMRWALTTKTNKSINIITVYFGINFVIAGLYSLWMTLQILLVGVSLGY